MKLPSKGDLDLYGSNTRVKVARAHDPWRQHISFYLNVDGIVFTFGTTPIEAIIWQWLAKDS
jgi:hypothetical protein